jgi:SAM-dependent methyltransferase
MQSSRLADQTIADFGRQWAAFVDNEGYYGSAELFLDVVSPLLSLEDIQGARIADVGSGTGRFALIFLNAGASHVVAVEPSESFPIVQQNTAPFADRITCLNQRGEDLPPGLDLDMVFSYGVINHIPDPLPTMRASRNALKPGGQCVAWVYGHEGNAPYIAVVRPLRWLTTKLPDRALMSLCSVLNVVADIYIAACRGLPLPLRGYMRNVFGKLERRRRYEVIFDQLNPTYVRYYRREEVRALFEAAGFVDIRLHHRHGYSWTAVGRRP